VNLYVASNAEDFAERSASFVRDRVNENPRLSLTLPTGSTPLGLYQSLRHDHDRGNFQLDRASVFMLDEYLDLPTYPRGSFVEYLRAHLGDLVFNATTKRHTMVPDESDAFMSTYDRALDDVGGIDLAIVGVGRNGHVGFNEPGSHVSLRTHAVALSSDTLNDNFADVSENERPTRAVTVGMRDLLEARTVLMLISGRAKRDVTSLLIDERVDESIPATQLLTHADLHVLVTSDTVADRVSA